MSDQKTPPIAEDNDKDDSALGRREEVIPAAPSGIPNEDAATGDLEPAAAVDNTVSTIVTITKVTRTVGLDDTEVIDE